MMTTISDKQETPMVQPADWIPGPRQGDWTYQAYAALPDDEHRYEIIQGVLMLMPAPEPAHQGIIGLIYRFLVDCIFLTNRGLVLMSPLDVVFSQKKVAQPDVVVILAEHMERVREKYIAGSPDLAVEVISPASTTYDRLVKYNLYEQEGVPEYWLVNPKTQTIEVFVLEAGKYRSLGKFRGEQPLQSHLVPDATVPVAQFFRWTGNLQ